MSAVVRRLPMAGPITSGPGVAIDLESDDLAFEGGGAFLLACVLERFFSLGRTAATRVMLEVHMKGKGVCGVFTYEIAETKVAQVTSYARDHQHPLMCTLEQA